MLSSRILLLLLMLLAGGAGTASAAAAPSDSIPAEETLRLEEKVEILAREVARLREERTLPATETERARGDTGLGPSASKVYGADPGLSLGGYGEWYLAAQLRDRPPASAGNTADQVRLVLYLGYKFNDRILLNTEIEFEHASTEENASGDAGEVSVEFAYLEFLLHDAVRLRMGNLLVPMGFLNRIHEPPYYYGNFRPLLERRILPTTWHEMGVGAHGRLAEGLHTTAYLLNGLDAGGFSEQGIRGGRQGANRVRWEDLAGVAAVEYDHGGLLRVGGAVYRGGADQNGATRPELASTRIAVTVWESHAQLRWRGLHFRAIYAATMIDGAENLTRIVYPDPSGKLIPRRQSGWYTELAWDVAPVLFGPNAGFQLSPWARYEDLDLANEVPGIPGRATNPTLRQRVLTLGLQYWPHPQVALKAEFVHTTVGGPDPGDELRVGAGFAF